MTLFGFNPDPLRTQRRVEMARIAALWLAPLLLAAVTLQAASLPLAFEPNRGQAASGARFVARTSGDGLVVVEDRGFKFVLAGQAPAAIHFLGASRHPKLTGAELLPGRANYFSGRNLEHSITGVPEYGRVQFGEVYPGIDAVLHGLDGSLEYDFVLAPHADPSRIRLGLWEDVSLEDGELVLGSGMQGIRQRRPVAYQEINGKRRVVACNYRLIGHRESGFELGSYDLDFPVVIDPVMWVSYLSGSIGVLAADADGNTYSAGWAPQSSSGNVTVVKLNPEGTAALFTASIATPIFALPDAIVLDSSGFIYVTGTTSGSGFPTTSGAYQTSGEGFLFKLGPDGSKIQYATQFHATPAAIAVDTSGSAYLTGTAYSDFQATPDAYEPNLTPGQCGGSDPTQTYPCSDAFILKLNPQATAAVYATFLGGSFNDKGSGIAVDANGNAHVTGATGSTDFPLAGAGTQSSFHGLVTLGPLWFGDAFVTELSADGKSLIFSTYLGGSGPDQGFGIGVDSNGNTYVAGQTSSTDFPVTKGSYRTSIIAQPPLMPELGVDGFVTKLNPDGSIVFSTYYQGTGGMWVDGSGNTYLATMQMPSGALPVCNQRGTWAQVLRADGAVLIQPNAYPSPGFNGSSTIGVDAPGNAYVTGITNSIAFLATPGAYQTQFSSDNDTYVGKVDFSAAPPRAIGCVINAASLAASNPRNYSPDGAVSPGEIITIYGNDIGPSPAASGTVANGRFTNQIGDTQLLFDGIAAPLLYAGPGQINAVVPFEIQSEASTSMVLKRSGVPTGPIVLPVDQAVPGVFLQGNPALEMAAAFNQDGTLNSAANPAARGSVITFYATGMGAFAPKEFDGEILPLTLPLPVPSMGASVLIGGQQAPVQYAGAAPGEVAGLLQVNCEVPESAPTGASVPLQLYIGNFVSQLALQQGQAPLSISVR